MKSLLGILSILSLLSLVSCNPQAAKSLLTTYQECTTDCPAAEQTRIDGVLSIAPDSTQISYNVDKGDLVEISGSCKDLGRKENRIIVNVFENADDESVSPYIDNMNSANCQANVLGMTTAQQCVFTTHGQGLIDPNSTPTRTFPRCVNGRFSFMVRVGNVSKVGAVIKNYLVRMKLWTPETTPPESEWARTTIKREVSVPNFTVLPDPTNLRCEIKIEGAKFKHAPFNTDNIPDITYMVKRDASGYTAGGGVNYIASLDRFTTFMSYSDLSQSGSGDSLANFYDDGLTHVVLSLNAPLTPPVPGVKYNYIVQARAGVDDSAESTAKVCDMPTPSLSVTTSATVCSVSLLTGYNSNFLYEWSYGSSGWTAANAGGIATGCGVLDSNCNFTMPVTAGTYFLAVRVSYAGLYGKWSTEVPCRKQ